MEENNIQQLNNQINPNNVNRSQEMHEEIEKNKSSSKYNIIIFILNN
jgi:hypothetical protein